MKIEKEYFIKLDKDLDGLSIGIKKTIIDDAGFKFESPVHRCAFRKYITDEEGNKTENKNFESEIEAFTGEKDFVKKKVNF